MLVKPDVAATQIDAERQTGRVATNGGDTGAGDVPGSVLTTQLAASGGAVSATITPQFWRTNGSVKLDPQRLVRDASKITEEVVQHLSSIVGADHYVALDIQVELPANDSGKLVRDVMENCRTLIFADFGFEEE